MKAKRTTALFLALLLALTLIGPAAALPETPRYVALGDSIAHGYGLADDKDGYAALVAEEIKAESFDNFAVDGLDTAGLLSMLTEARDDRSSALAKALAGANVVTISIGSNDILGPLLDVVADAFDTTADELALTLYYMASVDPRGLSDKLGTLPRALKKSAPAISEHIKAAAKNFESILVLLKQLAPNAELYATNAYNPYPGISMLSFDLGAETEPFIKELNDVVFSDPAGYQLVDVYSAFTEGKADGLTNADLGSANFDPHPSVEGHKKIASLILESMNKGYAVAPFFTDVAGHWAKDSILYAVQSGLFSGTTPTTFSPERPMSRGMLVAVLGRLAKADASAFAASSFSDVAAGSYYAGYVEWAYRKGVVAGSKGKFAPDRAVTREEIAVILKAYADKNDILLLPTVAPVGFSDAPSISSWARDAVAALQRAGILSGKTGNRFDPKGKTTRAEVAAVLRKFTLLTQAP